MAERRDGVVALIGVFKLLKAALLAAVGVTGLIALPDHVAQAAERAVTSLGIYSGRQTIEVLLEKISALDRSTERRLGVLSLCYAVVFVIEGLGLVRRKVWAEWMTVVVTASFIPLEIYEILAHFAAGKVIALALNVAIVVYLVRVRLHERRDARREVRHAVRAS
jgi:uncharacterized membrane protein (DUF2068 family)